MVPAKGAELPVGSDPRFIDKLRDFIESLSQKQGGIVTMVLEGEILGNMAWAGTPVLVVMDYFGMPYEWVGYQSIMDGLVSEPTLNDANVFSSPHNPRMLAVVQSQNEMTLEQAEEFLRRRRS